MFKIDLYDIIDYKLVKYEKFFSKTKQIFSLLSSQRNVKINADLLDLY